MARSWIMNFRGFAENVKNTNLSTADQVQDCGAYLDCPKCYYRIDNSDVLPEWPGFPAGVKFDPSDAEILEHLAAKCCIGNTEPHMFIHEFIPTLEGEQGICYTHPENLPGSKKDGSSVHFFNRTVNAYATGQRKRRKIHHQHGLSTHVRWHKTGKTKAVIEDGVHKGFKKIMVLYVRSQKESKPYKSNWVMHQYHLGSEEEEKDGEYVVSKVFYQQQKQTEKIEENPVAEDSDMASRTSEYVDSKVFCQQLKQTKEIEENLVAEDSDMVSRTGDYVVSKVSYQQQKQTEEIDENPVAEDSDMVSQTGEYVFSDVFYQQQKQTEKIEKPVAEDSDMAWRTGEHVVSKVFYGQQKQTEKNEENLVAEDFNIEPQTGPRTPNPNPPDRRPHTDKSVERDVNFYENELPALLIQDDKSIPEDNLGDPAWFAGEFHDLCDFASWDDILLWSKF